MAQASKAETRDRFAGAIVERRAAAASSPAITPLTDRDSVNAKRENGTVSKMPD